jgi:hypothetical protein
MAVEVDTEVNGMARRSVAIGIACLVLTSGCSGGDDEATADPDTGSVGDCYGQSSTKTVDCAGPHLAETVFVRAEAPPRTSEALAPCRIAQSHYLGQDFNTRLDVQLWIASNLSWYRCDVFVRNSTQGGSGYQSVSGSLKNLLREDVSVDLQSCLSEAYDPVGDQVYIPCSEPHVAQELIVAPAIGTLVEPFPRDIADRATRACNATASASGLLNENTRVEAFYPKTADAWASGERTADCWIAAKKDVLPPVQTTP